MYDHRINGAQNYSTPATYGIERVYAASNHPGIRHRASLSISDTSIILLSNNITGTMICCLLLIADICMGVAYSDLWVYDIASNGWCWVSGFLVPSSAYFGIIMNAGIYNVPGHRSDMASVFHRPSNAFYAFGGSVLYVSKPEMNDLWRFQLSNTTLTFNNSNVNYTTFVSDTNATSLDYVPADGGGDDIIEIFVSDQTYTATAATVSLYIH
jgi:hypothetical protein